MLTSSGRIHHIDEKVTTDVSRADYSNRLFLRLIGKKRKFENVDFKYSMFETSYLRDCVFDNCDFTGARFSNSNFYGSSFSGCKFDYAYFDKTILDSDILDSCCPPFENLKLKFARSLRMNYQSVGDSISVNKAIELELNATEIHLLKAWKSKESYYRKKYKSWKRVSLFFQWLNFKLLDIVWGNGESIIKLLRSVVIVLICMTFYDVLNYGDSSKVVSYFEALKSMLNVLFATHTSNYYSETYLTIVSIVRLTLFGFFMSIIIKRFNRR